MSAVRVMIVGAGPCGLAAAFRLRERGGSVTVLESRDRPGGNVGTLSVEGFRVEQGPNGFLDSKPGMMQLCRDLGLADRLIPASDASRKHRFVYHEGRLHALPGSLLAFLRSPLLTPFGKLRLLSEPLRHRPNDRGEESVASFARRRFGPEAANLLVGALVAGIHAGDPERLSVRAAFPRLAGFEREYGGVVAGMLATARAKRRAIGGSRPAPQRMWSFREGLQVLVDAMAERLGDNLRCRTTVDRVTRTGDGWVVHAADEQWNVDQVILTAPAYAQARILDSLDPVLAAELAAIEYAPIAVVVVGYRKEDVPHEPDGFGYIAPGHLRRDVLGVQWCSRIFPERAPPGFVLWRALCGGVYRPDLATRPDDELLRRVRVELAHTLQVTAPPAFVRVVRWPSAIPQLTLGHRDRLNRISARTAKHLGLHLAGNWSAGVALNDVAEQAVELAQQVSGQSV